MKKLIALLTIYSQLAYAGLPPTSVQGQSDTSAKTRFNFQAPHSQVTDLGGIKALVETGNTNILKNPGFEDSTSGWTASGGATAAINTTAVGTGKNGYDWDSNAAAQTLLSTSITIPNGLKGTNGLAYCNIKTVSGTATHTITVNDGTNDITTPITINSRTDIFARTNVNFIYPSSGTIRIKIASVASNEPNINIDDCFIGDAINVGTIQQAKLIGTVKITGCAAAWSTTSTSFASFATQASCSYAVTGEALAPTTNIPAIRFASLPPGEYKVEYEGALYTTATSGRQDADFQIYDGTNQFRETSAISGTTLGDFKPNFNSTFSYTSPQSNVTLEVRAKTSNSQTTQIYGTTARPGVIRVYYFPSASQQAVAAQNADYDWTSYTPTLSAAFGTPTLVSFQHKRLGRFLHVRGTFTSGTNAASLGTVSLPSGLTIDSTFTTINNTSANPGQRVGTFTSQEANNTGAIVTAPATSTSVVYFTMNSNAAGLLTPQNVSAYLTSNRVVDVSFSVPISGWNENQRAPVLVGSVTSNSAGAERIERVTFAGNSAGTSICNSSPCTIVQQSGSWVSSVTRSSIGVYNINMTAGTFSTVPDCTIDAKQFSGLRISTHNKGASSTSLVQINSYNTSSALSDDAFTVVCMGPR